MSDPGADRRDEVRRIVDEYEPRIKDSAIHFAPGIPAKKLRKALARYATDIHGIEVLLLIDNTSFGGAKDGAVMTPEAIYAHNMGQEPQSFRLDQIESVHFAEGWTSIMHVNDTPFLEINFPEKAAMRTFTSMVREISELFHAPEATAPDPVEALRKLAELHEAGILSDEEFADKKQKFLEQI